MEIYLLFMSRYECTFIVRQDALIQDVQKMISSTISFLEGFGCEIIRRDYAGLKSLAYPIKKNKKGHYVELEVGGSFEGLAALESDFRVSENVIRFMFLKSDARRRVSSVEDEA